MNVETLQIPFAKNASTTRETDRVHFRICKFVIVKRKTPKQKFVIYQLVPKKTRRNSLIRQMEKEICTEVSGYEVTRIERLDPLACESPSGTAFSKIEVKQYVSPKLPKLRGRYAQLGKLSEEIVKIRGVITLIFVDHDGRALYRKVNHNSGSGFKTDTTRIGSIASRALQLFKTAQVDDPNLGESQFVLIERSNFKAIFILIQQLGVVLRVAINKDLEARDVYYRIEQKIDKYYPKVVQKMQPAT